MILVTTYVTKVKKRILTGKSLESIIKDSYKLLEAHPIKIDIFDWQYKSMNVVSSLTYL